MQYVVCPNLDFTWHVKNSGMPPTKISITSVESLGNNQYEVDITFRADATMSLASLSELKIIGNLYKMLFSRNLNVDTGITNPGDWTTSMTITASPDSNGYVTMPVFTIQFDWCSAGVTDQSECNSWNYARSYDYFEGCNADNQNHANADSSLYKWPANCANAGSQNINTSQGTTTFAAAATTVKTTSTTNGPGVTTVKTTSTTANGNGQTTCVPNTAYGQCGGTTWSGNTNCVSGYYCSSMNDWFFQCVPGTSADQVFGKTSSVVTTTSTTSASTSKTTSSTSTSTFTSKTASSTPTTSTTSTSTSTSSTATITNNDSNTSAAPNTAYGQCGGTTWSGNTNCVSGYYCSSMNDWFFQCVPGTSADQVFGKTSSVVTTTSTTSASTSKTTSSTSTSTFTSKTASSTPTTSTTSTSTSTSSTATITNNDSNTSAAPNTAYGQCGGTTWSGNTNCVSGYYCSSMNDWFFQCVPGTSADQVFGKTSSAVTTTTSTPSGTGSDDVYPASSTGAASTSSSASPAVVASSSSVVVKASSAASASSSVTAVSSTAAGSTTSAAQGSSVTPVPAYGTCGGKTYTGYTKCVSGFHCQSQNEWYYQCVQGTGSDDVYTATSIATSSSSLVTEVDPAGKTIVVSSSSSVVVKASSSASASSSVTAVSSAATGSTTSAAQGSAVTPVPA
ncbi:hypothetical protein WICPIJ_007754, partial [Wickerhamomyces pijperi]